MSEAVLLQVVTAGDQFPSLVAYFRDDKTPCNSKLHSDNEGRGRQID